MKIELWSEKKQQPSFLSQKIFGMNRVWCFYQFHLKETNLPPFDHVVLKCSFEDGIHSACLLRAVTTKLSSAFSNANVSSDQKWFYSEYFLVNKMERFVNKRGSWHDERSSIIFYDSIFARPQSHVDFVERIVVSVKKGFVFGENRSTGFKGRLSHSLGKKIYGAAVLNDGRADVRVTL